MKIILIRHGETDKNAGGKLHSSGDTELLNDVGKQQIQKAAEALKQYKLVSIYHSLEASAKESAQILSKILECQTRPLEGMQERNWGKYTGKPWAEIKTELDKLTLEERYTFIPPDGESWQHAEERLIKALNEAISVTPKGQDLIIVTHSGAIRTLIPYLLGVPKEESFKYDPPNASLTIFEYSPSGFTKMLVSDTSHLAVSN